MAKCAILLSCINVDNVIVSCDHVLMVGHVPHVCSCGARYEAFRTGLTFAKVSEMLLVGSHDPELWHNRSRAAVLRLWAALKRDMWDAAHGYCEAAPAGAPDEVPAWVTDHERPRAVVAAVARREAAGALATLVPDAPTAAATRCDCDHCNPWRWMGNLAPPLESDRAA